MKKKELMGVGSIAGAALKDRKPVFFLLIQEEGGIGWNSQELKFNNAKDLNSVISLPSQKGENQKKLIENAFRVNLI